jgi:hypothetical protein
MARVPGTTHIELMRYRLLLPLFLLPLTTPGWSQSGFAIGGAGVLATANGKDFENIESGVGGDFTVRRAGMQWSWGVGASYLRYQVTGVSDRQQDLSLFFEPRYQLSERGDAALSPYLLARATVVYSRLRIPPNQTRRNGWSLGVGAGTLLRLAGSLDLDLGASVSYARFGNLHIDLGSRRDTGVDGIAMTLRAGFLLW